jgi:hypothetical protein
MRAVGAKRRGELTAVMTPEIADISMHLHEIVSSGA